jgi:hypothetical protein
VKAKLEKRRITENMEEEGNQKVNWNNRIRREENCEEKKNKITKDLF